MKFGNISIRNDVKSAKCLCNIAAILSLMPFYDFERKCARYALCSKISNITILICYIVFCYELTEFLVRQGVQGSLLLTAAEGLNYIFVFAFLIVCLLKNGLYDCELYVRFLQLIDTLDGKMNVTIRTKDYHNLLTILASFLFMNPIIWEYYCDFVILGDMPVIYLIIDVLTLPFCHVMLNLIATFAIMIKFRVRHVNDLFCEIGNDKRMNPRNYVMLKHILNLQKDINDIVMLFNDLFSWPTALYMPVFMLDIVYLLNSIFQGLPWDFLGFSIHDTVS